MRRGAPCPRILAERPAKARHRDEGESDEEANHKEKPTDHEDAETEGGEPQAKKGKVAEVEPSATLRKRENKLGTWMSHPDIKPARHADDARQHARARRASSLMARSPVESYGLASEGVNLECLRWRRG
jgi:hypothetical protein